MFHRGLESMFHVTAKSQGLSWELKVAAQERQKLFLQEIKERLIAPFPPAASGRRWTALDATLGRREKEKEVILTMLLVQSFRCLQIDCLKNCYTTLQFQEQERIQEQ